MAVLDDVKHKSIDAPRIAFLVKIATLSCCASSCSDLGTSSDGIDAYSGPHSTVCILAH